MLNMTANTKTRFPVSWSRLFDLEKFGRGICPNGMENRDLLMEEGRQRDAESEKWLAKTTT